MSNQREPVTNEPSSLLTSEENELVFAALGARRITKATAVAQVYHAHPDPGRWTKYKTGVVCFVKDNLRKSYYIRLLEMNAKGFTIAWEQELYNQFTYKKDLPRFHHFPGDKFMVGLNFSSEDEADKFLRAMETKIKDRQHRRQTLKQRKDNTFARSGPSSPPGHPAPPLPNTTQPNPPRSSPLTTIPEPSHNINVTTTPSSGGNKGQKGKRKKINKSDISGPSNFQHLAHVGWDPNTGAFDSNNIDAAWKKLFDTVGVSDTDLKDEKTAKFIYEFVEQHGGIEKANQQLEAERQKAPPPPPSHGGGRRNAGAAPPPPPPHNRGAPHPPSRNAPPPPPPSHHHPPPPPSRSAPPPPPSRHGGGGNVPAPPPLPPVNVPAPPPPPPVSSGGPPPPPSQSNKPSSNLPVVSDARANLMESIRAGKTLHKVEEQPPAEKKQPESDGIAGALARALLSRKDAIADTDSSDDDEYEDDEEDWSD